MADRFVVVGFSRLAIRIVSELARDGHRVDLLCDDGPLVRRLDRLAGVDVGPLSADLAHDLEAVDLAGADCLLAVDDDELANLRAVRAAAVVAPKVPAVARAKDPELFEQLAGPTLRRAFSPARLAAPTVIARGFGNDVHETLRLADVDIPLLHLARVEASPLNGLTPAEVKARLRCAPVAYRRAGVWSSVRDATPERFEPGDEVVVGGLVNDVLAVATAGRHSVGDRFRLSPRRRFPRLRPEPARNLVRVAALVWLALTAVVAASLVRRGAGWSTPTSLAELAVGTISTPPQVARPLAAAYALGSLVLGAVLLAQLTTWFTASRSEQWATRRAARLRNHVVVGGLGDVGGRVVELLRAQGRDVVVIERDADSVGRAELLRLGVPVLTGDLGRLEVLQRAGVDSADALLGCTDDDLANVAAAHAAVGHCGCGVVARVFDDLELPDIATVSASRLAARAFLAAATDPHATRTFSLDGQLDLQARRVRLRRQVSATEVATWRAAGLRVLAFRDPDGRIGPPSDLPDPLGPGFHVVLAGPPAELGPAAASAS